MSIRHPPGWATLAAHRHLLSARHKPCPARSSPFSARPALAQPNPLHSVLAQHARPPPPVQPGPDIFPLPAGIADSLARVVDPFALLAAELGDVKQSVKALAGSGHPTLDRIAKYYFSAAHHGKHLRPLIVLLVAQAAAPSITSPSSPYIPINEPLSPADVLSDTNPTAPSSCARASIAAGAILPTQRRLAEIAEMLHVASLLHDDVIDTADSRRGTPSSPRVFGNKLSVLAGDFLLARASLALARLGNVEVVELIASVVANLVEGELMQLSGSVAAPGEGGAARPQFTDSLFEQYERKNYLKTAALMAKTARGAVLLAGNGSETALVEASYRFGKHLGLAFQIVDDILDLTGTAEGLGKPAGGSDLRAGLVTGPGLFAWKAFGDDFGALVGRKFARDGDIELAQRMVDQAKGIEQSYELAKAHLAICKDQLENGGFMESEARAGLERLCELVLERSH